MKRIILGIVGALYFGICFFILLSERAYAYIDATSVTYIVQAVVGVFVAIGAVITIQRHKIVAAYRKWYYGKIAKKNEKLGMKNKEASEEKGN